MLNFRFQQTLAIATVAVLSTGCGGNGSDNGYTPPGGNGDDNGNGNGNSKCVSSPLFGKYMYPFNGVGCTGFDSFGHIEFRSDCQVDGNSGWQGKYEGMEIDGLEDATFVRSFSEADVCPNSKPFYERLKCLINESNSTYMALTYLKSQGGTCISHYIGIYRLTSKTPSEWEELNEACYEKYNSDHLEQGWAEQQWRPCIPSDADPSPTYWGVK